MKDRTGNLLTDRSYRRLLDSLYEGVYLVDRDRTIVYWNDAAEQMTGYKRSEVVGKHCWDGLLMHVDNRGTSLCTDRCLLHEAMELKKSMEGKVFFHHRDGHEVPVTVRTTPILGDRGSVLGAAQIFSDNSSTEDLGRKIRELERMALLDPLTRLGNRRYGQMNLSGSSGNSSATAGLSGSSSSISTSSRPSTTRTVMRPGTGFYALWRPPYAMASGRRTWS